MLKNKYIRCVQTAFILFHSKCFITIEEAMMEKLVGANNVQLNLERHYIQRRKVDYSHIFKRIKTTLMNFLLNYDLLNIIIFSLENEYGKTEKQ